MVAPGGANDGGNPVDAGDIYSTMPDYPVTFNDPPYNSSQDYGYLSGTSMAAPQVTGLAGLILSWIDPDYYTASDIRGFIEQSADPKGAPGRDNYYGWGRINAVRALSLSDGPPAAPTGLVITNAGQFLQNPILQWNGISDPDLDR